MKWNRKYYNYLFAVILLIAGSLALALIVPNLNQVRAALSKKFLTQSQNTDDINKKIAFLLEADLLAPSDEIKLELAITADNNGNLDISRMALSEIKSVETLLKWPIEKQATEEAKVIYIYLELKPTYPQSASKFIRHFSSRLQGSRDGLLTLSEDYFIAGDYIEAENYALQARELDKYYPQTYQQLIEISTKLNKTGEVNAYRKFLESITW